MTSETARLTGQGVLRIIIGTCAPTGDIAEGEMIDR